MVGWWYIVDNQRQGPVTLPTLEKLLQHRILGAKSLVWREGLPQWTPLDIIDELKPLLGSPPPLLPLTPAPLTTTPTTPGASTPAVSRLRAARHKIIYGVALCVLIAAGATVYRTHNVHIRDWAGYFKQKLSISLFATRSPQRQDILTMGAEHRWQNPLTRAQANIDSGWIIKQLAVDQNTLASSFISDNIVVNLSVVKGQNQTLIQLVDYLKTNEPSLRFIDSGTYSQTRGFSNWTGIATSPADQARHYVVHVTNAKAGYGIFIAAVNQQTAASFSRLEALTAQLDRTFGGN